MALLVSLLLIRNTGGEPTLGALAAFLIIVCAAVINSIGRSLQVDSAPRNRFLRDRQ